MTTIDPADDDSRKTTLSLKCYARDEIQKTWHSQIIIKTCVVQCRLGSHWRHRTSYTTIVMISTYEHTLQEKLLVRFVCSDGNAALVRRSERQFAQNTCELRCNARSLRGSGTRLKNQRAERKNYGHILEAVFSDLFQKLIHHPDDGSELNKEPHYHQTKPITQR